MDDIKINTIPNGKKIIIVMSIMLVLLIVMAVILKEIRSLLIFFILGTFGGIIFAIYQKHLNTIFINESGVRHKDKFIPWSEVNITMFFSLSFFRDRNYYIAFGTSFYSTKDIKKIFKQGFYIMLTPRSLNIITKNYKQKIVIINESGYQIKLYKLVNQYNESLLNQD